MPKINKRKQAAVRRANDALFSTGQPPAHSEKSYSQSLSAVPSSSSSSSVPPAATVASSSLKPPAATVASSPTPPATLPVQSVEEDSQDSQQAELSDIELLQIAVLTVAFDEGKFIYDHQQTHPDLFIKTFKAAFLYVDSETAERTWKIDIDIFDSVVSQINDSPKRFTTTASVNPTTGKTILTDTSENQAVETICNILLELATLALPYLPTNPNFAVWPIPHSISCFHLIGKVTLRAFSRGKVRFNTNSASIRPEAIARLRQNTMAEQANLLIVDEQDNNSNNSDIAGDKDKSTAGVVTSDKARKRREKRARQRANKAVRAKEEDEEAKKDVTEGDSAEPEPEEHCTAGADEPISVPVGLVSNMAAMISATEALSVHGARPPVGLSQRLGVPLRRPAVPPRQALANEIENLLTENAHLPAAQRRRVWAAARDRLLQSEPVAAARRQFDVGGMPGWAGELEAMQAEGLRGGKGKGKGKEAEKK